MKDKVRKDSLASDTSSNADKKLQNQFSFVERATQTMNNSLKVFFLNTRYRICANKGRSRLVAALPRNHAKMQFLCVFYVTI